MNIARRMITVAASDPQETLKDVLGLSALCLMIFAGLTVPALF